MHLSALGAELIFMSGEIGPQERVQKRTVNVSVEMQSQVFLIQEVQGTMEVPQGQYIDRIVDVSVCCNTKYDPSEQCTSRHKTVDSVRVQCSRRTLVIHQVRFIDRIIEVLVVLPRPVASISSKHTVFPRHSPGVSETRFTTSSSKYRPTSFQVSRGLHINSSTNSCSDRCP